MPVSDLMKALAPLMMIPVPISMPVLKRERNRFEKVKDGKEFETTRGRIR